MTMVRLRMVIPLGAARLRKPLPSASRPRLRQPIHYPTAPWAILRSIRNTALCLSRVVPFIQKSISVSEFAREKVAQFDAPKSQCRNI